MANKCNGGCVPAKSVCRTCQRGLDDALKATEDTPDGPKIIEIGGAVVRCKLHDSLGGTLQPSRIAHAKPLAPAFNDEEFFERLDERVAICELAGRALFEAAPPCAAQDTRK